MGSCSTSVLIFTGLSLDILSQLAVLTEITNFLHNREYAASRTAGFHMGYDMLSLWFNELKVTVYWISMKACRIPYENACRTLISNGYECKAHPSKGWGNRWEHNLKKWGVIGWEAKFWFKIRGHWVRMLLLIFQWALYKEEFEKKKRWRKWQKWSTCRWYWNKKELPVAAECTK